MGRTSGYEQRTITMEIQGSKQQRKDLVSWFQRQNYWYRCCLTTIFLILPVFVILGVLLWLQINSTVLRPRQADITMAVTDASLNITDQYSNNYNLDLSIALRNTNKYFRIFYGEALVVAEHRHKSDMATIAEFHQPTKNTTILTPSFKLERDNNITDNAAASTQYDIHVRLDLPIKKFKSVTWVRFGDSGTCSAIFTCDLKVPLQNGSLSATTAFISTKCQLQSRYTNGC